MNAMQTLTRKTLGGSLSSSMRRSAAAVGQRRSYHDNIVEHYENPRNVGSLDKKDKFVGTVRIRQIAEKKTAQPSYLLMEIPLALFFFFVLLRRPTPKYPT